MRPGRRTGGRGLDRRRPRGCKMARGTHPPEPRGHRRKCGGTEAARPIPGRGPPDTGPAGGAGPAEALCPVPPRGRFPLVGEAGEGRLGSGSVPAPQRRCLCVCPCSKSRPSWLPPRAKMGKRRAGGPRRSPGEVAGPLTTIAAIAARKEGICCAAITAPPLSTSSAGKARRCPPSGSSHPGPGSTFPPAAPAPR